MSINAERKKQILMECTKYFVKFMDKQLELAGRTFEEWTPGTIPDSKKSLQALQDFKIDLLKGELKDKPYLTLLMKEALHCNSDLITAHNVLDLLSVEKILLGKGVSPQERYAGLQKLEKLLGRFITRTVEISFLMVPLENDPIEISKSSDEALEELKNFEKELIDSGEDPTAISLIKQIAMKYTKEILRFSKDIYHDEINLPKGAPKIYEHSIASAAQHLMEAPNIA